MRTPDLLVVGESLVDVTIGSDGSTEARPGGSPLNIAVGCARLDLSTILASQIGDDEYGEQIREHLDASDVDVRSLPPHRDDSSVARAFVDETGHATYEFELTWDPTELPTADGLGCLHIGSIAAALPPGADAVRSLAEDAHRLGVPVSFDPNVRTTITPDVDALRGRVGVLAGLAALVKLSDEDAATLFPGTDDVLTMLVDNERTALAVMTCGGSSVRLRSTSAHVEVTPPTVDVVDTIGAGDSFMSALLVALVENDLLARSDFDAAELRELGTYAARAAAITCTRRGADPPTRAELGPTTRERA
ncbi:MAG: carbohydrate kinase family protein [Nocardioidaceae bacterium]